MSTTLIVEVAGALVMIIVAVRAWRDFRRGRTGGRFLLGTLVMLTGILITAARRVYFHSSQVVPPTWWTAALVIGLALAAGGFVIMLAGWRREHRKSPLAR